MEPQNPNQFTTVTKLSKLLAALLFITLPFVGLYIGYTFAPEKVVEVEVERVVERVVDKEATEQITEVLVQPESDLTYSLESQYFQYTAAPYCDPYTQNRGPFTLLTGDGGTYEADCKGVIDHAYSIPGTYTARYIENNVVLSEFSVQIPN